MAWLYVEHAADLPSKHEAGGDGRVGYDVMKGESTLSYGTVELGGGKAANMGGRWVMDILRGFYFWMTGGAMLGSGEGVRLASAITIFRARRRWDAGEWLHRWLPRMPGHPIRHIAPRVVGGVSGAYAGSY